MSDFPRNLVLFLVLALLCAVVAEVCLAIGDLLAGTAPQLIGGWT